MESDRDARIRLLAGAGKTDREIARVLGCHWESVRQVRRRLGVSPGKPKPLNDSDRTSIRNLHASGMNDQEIADVLGVTKSNITYHRKRMGLVANRRQKAVPDDELMRMADEGIPCSVIAERVGLSRELVTRRVNRLFRERLGRPPGNFNRNKAYTRRTRKTRDYDDDMIRLLREGKTQEHVAQALGISRRTVRRRLRAIFDGPPPF